VAWIPLGPREVYEPSYHVAAPTLQRERLDTTVNNTVVNNTTQRHRNKNVTTSGT